MDIAPASPAPVVAKPTAPETLTLKRWASEKSIPSALVNHMIAVHADMDLSLDSAGSDDLFAELHVSTLNSRI